MKSVVSKLDLGDYIDSFLNFLSREKPLFIEGDINLHYRLINELSKADFTPPKRVKNLDKELTHLKKFGVLKIDEIYEFVKIVNYFKYLKSIKLPDLIEEWLNKIVIPEPIDEIVSYFNEKGELREDIDEKMLSISKALEKNKERIREALNRLLSSQKLSNYLVDRQIHYVNDVEALLVRGGFNHVLKATVVGRSSGGFFYVVPQKIESLKKEESALLSKRDELIYGYEKSISQTFNKFLKFLSFINREFDRFDHYQARVFFAKEKDLNFILPSKDRKIILKNFIHPALHDPKPINVEFEKKILMITGVNAGGKTMLLKSILSAVFLAKYLIPMQIDKHHSKIAHFKDIVAVVDDPQNVKNDISTFAGRMVEFSRLFSKNNFIAGIDEIELGTDSDEAASLFKVILESLLHKDIKIVITTHHKRLASMMATNDEVELMAALYDEVNRRPTYEFLKGTIGKSYAFETALRYGIPQNIVAKAKEVYGEDKEKLNELIEKNIELELSMKKQKRELEENLKRVKKQKESLREEREKFQESIKELKAKLEMEYMEAVNEAKRAAKEKSLPEIHKTLNKAYKKREAIKDIVEEKKSMVSFQKGDRVKYNKTKGVILSLKKDEALIELDEGIKMRVPIKDLKRSGNPPKIKPKTPSLKVEKPKQASITLDLHGLRSDEAIEKLDKFLSDALIEGFDEVLVYHGIGTGKLAYAVREFLKTHPKIKSFQDAPPSMGGYGATIVKL